MSTAAATSGIRNYGACFCTWKDTILENFTNSVAGNASLILDARFHYWVEENHFDGLEIRNCYYGVCFTSEDDQNGIAASCMNNVFTDTHIWVAQANGKGLYGVGLGVTRVVQLSRAVFVSPSVDVFGNPGIIGGYIISASTY